jgi:hypothetical protein
MKTGQGVLAEYTLVEKHLLTKKPDNVSFEEAASFPLTTFTAYSCLVQKGGLQKGKGQRVFIVRVHCVSRFLSFTFTLSSYLERTDALLTVRTAALAELGFTEFS